MVVVNLSKEVLDDLAPVSRLDASSLNDFLNTSLDSIRSGPPTRNRLMKVGDTLGLEWTHVASMIHALAQSMLDAARVTATPDEFVAAFDTLALSPAHKQTLSTVVFMHTYISNNTTTQTQTQTYT